MDWESESEEEPGELEIISPNEMGNGYWKYGLMTWYICATCIAWLAEGHWEYLSKAGCRFLPSNEVTAKYCKHWEDKNFSCCGRCFVKSLPCYAVSIFPDLIHFGPFRATLAQSGPRRFRFGPGGTVWLVLDCSDPFRSSPRNTSAFCLVSTATSPDFRTTL